MPADAAALASALREWDEGVWCLASLALASRADRPVLAAAAREVLAASGLMATPDAALPSLMDTGTPTQLASQAAAPLHQVSRLVSGESLGWDMQTDEALLAQGHASAQGAAAFARFMVPMLGDLGERLARPGARMLDVGTGVGALAVGFAQEFPQVHVVGIDVLDRALQLARQTIAASDVADRVTVRKQDVAEFADAASFDLAWLPAPFVPESAIRGGLPRIVTALRPGGWLLVGHGKLGGNPLHDALTRLKTVAYGGTVLDDAAACRLLEGAGLTCVQTMPTPPGAPGFTAGRKPS